MIFNSTEELQPNFFRGLYLSKLNNRVTDIENELDLLNLNMVTNDTLIRQQISDLQNSYNAQFITTNLTANKANINYLEVTNFANVDNIFANNIWTERLTVNKPVYDLTLNTPHIENASSLNGNFYTPNLFNAWANTLSANTINVTNIEVPVLANVNLVETNSIFIKNDITFNFKLNNIDIEHSNLISSNVINSTLINTAIELRPQEETYNVVGFNTETGILYPAVVRADLSLPSNADYLYTNEGGFSFAGKAESEVTQDSTNLIQSAAVYNLGTSLNDNINNSIFNLESRVADEIQNIFNYMYDSIENVNVEFNNVYNTLNEINSNEIIKLKQQVVDLTSYINSVQQKRGYFNSTSPISYTTATTFAGFETGVTQGTAVNGTMINLSGSTVSFNIKYINTYGVIPGPFLNCSSMFFNCVNLVDGNFTIPNTVTDTSSMFQGCRNFNQPITIPDTVTNASSMLSLCSILNQPITIGNSVTNASSMFQGCRNFNQPITIPDTVTNASSMLHSCVRFNQPVTIPNNVTNISFMFYECSNINQPITIGNSVTDASFAFIYCNKLNISDLNIYSDKLTNMMNMFQGTQLYNCNIHLHNTVPLEAGNYIYDALTNGLAGIDFTGKIFNDL